MKTWKRILGLMICAAMAVSAFTACGGSPSSSASSSSQSSSDESEPEKQEIKVFSFFGAVPGTEVPSDNRIINVIAEKIGARAEVTWLTGQTAAERIGVMIAGGDYPDLIDGSDGTPELIEAGALIPIDEYWDDYPNIKNYLTEAQWNTIRREDGHIYLIPQFGVIQGEPRNVTQSGEAFWIQKRVLEWDNYPDIQTLDEYFDLINRYLEANPANEDGTQNIGFEILSEDWRYFCLENPPMFLAGYPNDGCAIVDTQTLEAKVYDMLPEAKAYFNVLNEQYHKGTIDPETFTMSYDQYIAKISSGRVLGLIDQEWQFLTARDSLISQGLYERTYVPLDLVLDESVTPHYAGPPALSNANGLSITTSCEDIEGAMQFINDLLSPEVMILRYWGEEEVDYHIDENGVFYRDEEQRANARDTDWVNKNLASGAYSYLPHFEGVLADGKNSVLPGEQPGEYYESLVEYDKDFLAAYGYKTWLDFLDVYTENTDWFPLWSYRNSWTGDADYVIASQKMDEVKHEWLPKVVMSDDYESTWDEYVSVYQDKVDVEAYETEVTAEVARRIATAAGN